MRCHAAKSLKHTNRDPRGQEGSIRSSGAALLKLPPAKGTTRKERVKHALTEKDVHPPVTPYQVRGERNVNATVRQDVCMNVE